MSQISLPDNWNRAQLKDVCASEPQNGAFIKNPEFGSGVPFVNVKDIYRDIVVDLNVVERLLCDEISARKYALKDDDILFVRSSLKRDGIGQCCVVKGIQEPAIYDCHLIRVSPDKDKADALFLGYYFLSSSGKEDLIARSKTTTMTTINQKTLYETELVLPPIREQRAIARTLRAVQEARELRQKELQLERERKAALMQHLFTHGTRSEARKQTEIGEMPESWQVVKLAELCTNGSSVIQTGPFGSQLHASDYKQSGIPVVNPTHLGFNTIVEDRLPFISKEDADRLSKHYLIEGDILISRRGDFGRYSYVSKQYAGWLCGTGCLLIRLKNNLVDNFFLSVSMGLETVQNYLNQNAVGSIMPNLNTRILSSLPLPLPAIEEQQLIAQALHSCSTKIAAIEKESALLDELFRALLEKLMTGKLSAMPLIEQE